MSAGCFVGYYKDSGTYKVWNPETRQFFKMCSLTFKDTKQHSNMSIPAYNVHDNKDDDNPIPMDISPQTMPLYLPLNASHPSWPLIRALSPLTNIEEVD